MKLHTARHETELHGNQIWKSFEFMSVDKLKSFIERDLGKSSVSIIFGPIIHYNAFYIRIYGQNVKYGRDTLDACVSKIQLLLSEQMPPEAMLCRCAFTVV